MYEKFFQLRERPFALSPDPEYLYPSRVHQEALSYLRYGIEGHAGFVAITGEIGSGKTTLLQTVLGRLDSSTIVSRIVNTMLEPRELLEAIMLDFGLDPTGRSKPLIVRAIADYLVAQRNAGRLVLLVIDEAQNLSYPALEEVRMLSNFETEKSKLLQIVLIGQPDLRAKLNSPQLEQLRQRVTVSYHLDPLSADETHAYINHRLKRAAAGAPPEFPRAATDLIHLRSGGIPRTINIIADATLLTAYGADQRIIDAVVVVETIAELDTTGVLAPVTRSQMAGGAAAMAAAPITVPAEATAHDAVLAARERELRAREDALSARQRVLEEEARLLREAQRARTEVTPPQTAPSAAAAETGATPVPAISAATAAKVPAGAPETRDAAVTAATPPSPAPPVASVATATATGKPATATHRAPTAPTAQPATRPAVAPHATQPVAAKAAAASPSTPAAAAKATVPTRGSQGSAIGGGAGRTAASPASRPAVPVPARPAPPAARSTAAPAQLVAARRLTPPWPTRTAAIPTPAAAPPRRKDLFTEWERPKPSWWARLWRALVGLPEPEGF